MDSLNLLRCRSKEARSKSALAAASNLLLGASKGQSAETIASFIEAGLTHCGENRVQEAQNKWPDLKKRYPQVTLHLIGPLQTNKVREALELFDVIQTLDRPKLAEAIAKELSEGMRQGARGKSEGENSHASCLMPHAFFIQVNTGEEPQKTGVSPKEAPEFIRYCRELGLNVVGLMCVPPVQEMPAPHFALLRKLAHENGLSQLSMGMSSDFETAIRMGSTCVRIGTALFGSRSVDKPVDEKVDK